jgi:hypothetical protein
MSAPFHVRNVTVDATGAWTQVFPGIQARIPATLGPMRTQIEVKMEPVPVRTDIRPPWAQPEPEPEPEPQKVYVVWGRPGLGGQRDVVVLTTMSEIRALRAAGVKGRWLQTLEVDGDDEQEGP